MIYYGIFNDGNFIDKHKLEDLAQVIGWNTSSNKNIYLETSMTYSP